MADLVKAGRFSGTGAGARPGVSRACRYRPGATDQHRNCDSQSDNTLCIVVPTHIPQELHAAPIARRTLSGGIVRLTSVVVKGALVGIRDHVAATAVLH